MKERKRVFMILAILFLFIPNMVFANEAEASTEDTGIALATAEVRGGSQKVTANDVLPEVSIDDATDWVDAKGSDTIAILTQFGQWFSYVVFIVGASIALVGALSGKAGKGLSAMFIAVLMYVGITYGPFILDFISQWLGQ